MRTTNGAADYIQLDGVRLDGYGWNYKRAVAPSLPSVRSASSTMPGRPGRVYVSGTDVHEAAEVPITVQVFPANPVTGIIESSFSQRRAQLEDNLQTLLAVIGHPGRSLTYRYVDADGTAWQAQAVVSIPAKVDIRANNFVADLTFSLEIPGVYLRSEQIVETFVSSGTNQVIEGLSGGTAPIYDAVLKVPGYVANPRIEVGGHWVTCRGSVANWTVDTGRMTSTSMGRSKMADTGWSGTNMLVLQPTVDANGNHTYRATANTTFGISARKARYA